MNLINHSSLRASSRRLLFTSFFQRGTSQQTSTPLSLFAIASPTTTTTTRVVPLQYRSLAPHPTTSARRLLSNAPDLFDQSTPPPPKAYESLSTQKSKNVVAEKSFFDTHLFINSLVSSGFEQRQAERLCDLFKEIVNFVATDIKRDCVTKAGLDLAIQQIMIQIGSLKKDMIILEKSEFSALRNENEKLIIELKNLRDALNDEIVKLKGGFTLDINLEKNRSTEAGYDINNKIHKLDSRIDTEVSNLKAILEAFKADSIKFIAGSLFTVLVIILGALRYFTM